MTAHELARYLLEQEDLPVMVNGWGSDEGTENEVTWADEYNGRIWLQYGVEMVRPK
jgi:hypothetical protein